MSPGPPGGTGPHVLTVGAVVWLASELMFFSGLFATYFTLRSVARGGWSPEGVELGTARAGLFTLVLVGSSATVQGAVRSLGRGDVHRFQVWTALTMAFGVLFLVNQGSEWAALGFSVSSHTYGSVFYVLTGFHGLHVAGGLAAMAVFMGRSAGPAWGVDDLPAVEVLSYYWHFVDVVWVGLFATLFLIR